MHRLTPCKDELRCPKATVSSEGYTPKSGWVPVCRNGDEVLAPPPCCTKYFRTQYADRRTTHTNEWPAVRGATSELRNKEKGPTFVGPLMLVSIHRTKVQPYGSCRFTPPCIPHPR